MVAEWGSGAYSRWVCQRVIGFAGVCVYGCVAFGTVTVVLVLAVFARLAVADR